MRVARGSASLLSSHGRGIRPLDALKDSQDLSRAPSLWTSEPGLLAEGSGAGGVQTAKASRKQSSLSGKESAQGCIPKRLLGRPDEALGEGNQGPSAPGPLPVF